MSGTRGVRNNNPGNIRKGIPWDGLAKEQTDPSFDQFISAEYGIRALAKLLLAYQDFHGLNTIEGIINRWAPPVENATNNYVAAVCESSGFSADEVINLHDPHTLTDIADGIIQVECAGFKYDTGTMQIGIGMAEPATV
jgi:hypothetical protein